MTMRAPHFSGKPNGASIPSETISWKTWRERRGWWIGEKRRGKTILFFSAAPASRKNVTRGPGNNGIWFSFDDE
jgi:hypothetical protein